MGIMKSTFVERALLAAVAVLGLAACQSDQQMLDSSQPMALDTAVNRARFDMNCPTATGSVLSRQVIEPVVQTRFGGVTRYEYTIGVEGCGKRTSSVVICPEGGGGCFAAQERK